MNIAKCFICFLMLQISFPVFAQSSYVVYNATRGVILKFSTKYIENPFPGTKVSTNDIFVLNDRRYEISIKDTACGEIFSFTGKKCEISTLQIVNSQKKGLFEKFCSFLLSIAEETGFNTKPVRTSQCDSHKGGKFKDEKNDSLSLDIAAQIRNVIADSLYFQGVDVKKENSDDGTFNYSIQKTDTIQYAFIIFTVGENGYIERHNRIIKGSRTDYIEYVPLMTNDKIKLDYFSMAPMEKGGNRTCYVILFKPCDFYEEIKESIYDYKCLVNWDRISKELKYQGNVERAILIKE